MLGDIILSWKYPTRLVMVSLVPIGAFFFLISPFLLASIPGCILIQRGRRHWREREPTLFFVRCFDPFLEGFVCVPSAVWTPDGLCIVVVLRYQNLPSQAR